ncbi:hypothetical protein RhiirC2_735393 [Rhizophagus irregularis]|uniref:Uncharacterized protein n=1 Tax=Rhizophagus irregularis TaxID=588596 RepID=A0A2N1NQ83_9GLOM|nr:hypothetical protein RhiirC2_735393 [Rhizophagus irregularis]
MSIFTFSNDLNLCEYFLTINILLVCYGSSNNYLALNAIRTTYKILKNYKNFDQDSM